MARKVLLSIDMDWFYRELPSGTGGTVSPRSS